MSRRKPAASAPKPAPSSAAAPCTSPALHTAAPRATAAASPPSAPEGVQPPKGVQPPRSWHSRSSTAISLRSPVMILMTLMTSPRSARWGRARCSLARCLSAAPSPRSSAQSSARLSFPRRPRHHSTGTRRSGGVGGMTIPGRHAPAPPPRGAGAAAPPRRSRARTSRSSGTTRAVR